MGQVKRTQMARIGSKIGKNKDKWKLKNRVNTKREDGFKRKI